MNKNLIIFFGEYRNFDNIIPQLNLNGFDIIVSTWKYQYKACHGGEGDVIEKNKIQKILPNAKIIIHDTSNCITHYNTMNMIFHFKSAFKLIEDSNYYEKIIFHRFDLLSNINCLLNYTIEPNTMYVDWGASVLNIPWIQDYIFIGDYSVFNTYLNKFPIEDDFKEKFGHDAHLPHGHVLIENKINYKNLSDTFSNFRYRLCKWDVINNDEEFYLNKYNNMGCIFFDLDKNSDCYKQMYEEIKNDWNRKII